VTSFAYPVTLDVAGKRAVVVGRDAIAAGKVEALRDAGADVVVVEGVFRPEVLDGAFLCVASSPDVSEREAIFQAARDRGVLVNVMDDPARCDFAAPAIVRRGDLTIAIATGGRSPALARRLREELERRFGEEWAEVMDVIGEAREETLSALPDLGDRIRRWQQALDLDEVESLVREGRGAEAKERLRSRLIGATA
jgi:precorrin-2 dehydrogenase/sirohydrochlorin ferrochelatase